MTPRSVAAALHKDLAPHQAAAVSAPTTALPFDFLQLLSNAQSQTNTAGNNTTSSQTSPPPVQPQKPKSSDSTDANAALAALAAQIQQQPTSANTALANAQNPATTTPAPAPAATPGTAAALAAAAAANKNDPIGQSGQTVPLPPGAADVEARVVKGAPTLLSQPSSLYAGLWHHSGEATPQTPLTGANQGNAEPAAAATNDAPAPQIDGTKTAALGPTLAAAAAHDDSTGTSVASIAPDPGQDGVTTATSDATAATSATAAAPVTADTQTAPGAAPGAPAIVTPAHVLPVYEQVAISLKQAAQAGDNRIEIQLKPASLGTIAVKLDVTHDGHITAVISADRSDTLNMLRQDLAGLQQAMRDAGLQTDAGSLSFNLNGGAQSFAQNSPQQAPASSSPSTSTPSSLPDAPAARTRAHSGALDIEV